MTASTSQNTFTRTPNYVLVCHTLSVRHQRFKPFSLQGRQRPLPEIEHVESEPEEDNQPPSHLRKYSLYSMPPVILTEKFLNKASKSHMQKHFDKGISKEEKALKKGVRKSYQKRKGKPQSKYVTKQAKFEKLKDVLVQEGSNIDAILKLFLSDKSPSKNSKNNEQV